MITLLQLQLLALLKTNYTFLSFHFIVIELLSSSETHCRTVLHLCITHLSSFHINLCHSSCLLFFSSSHSRLPVPPSSISLSVHHFLNRLRQRSIVVDFIHVIRHNYVNGSMNGFHGESVGFVWEALLRHKEAVISVWPSAPKLLLADERFDSRAANEVMISL